LGGAPIGAPTAGSKAVARIPSMAGIYAIEYIQNQAGKIRSMTGGQASMPFVLWVDGAGRSRGMAGQHTDVGMESLYAQLPGMKVVAPSTAYDAKGLMITAIRPDVPDDAYEIPLGKAEIRQQGRDLTLVAWAPATTDVKRALPDLEKAGISVEFIDPRSLKPLDVDTLVASARKTRRLLVVEHGHYTAGFGAHVVAEVVQEVPGVKVRRLAFPDVPGPGSAVMMSWLRPDAPKIVDAAAQLMKA
jgi:pyruvate dehydrogenase E1 component beta subunit